VLVTETYEKTLTDIEDSIGIIPKCLERLPEKVLMRYWPFLKRYQLGESCIPEKYRELISLALVANMKCRSCLLTFRAMAKSAGATDDEISEAMFLANHAARWSDLHHPSLHDPIVTWQETKEYWTTYKGDE